MNTSPAEIIKSAERVSGTVERWVIVGLIAFLICFALLQIVLRNFFSTGFLWGDTLLRHVVLWAGMLGAMRATAEGRHIGIDLIPRMLPPPARRVVEILVELFPMIVCAVLFQASVKFVENERLAGGIALGNIPYWWLQLIFPLGFAVMAVRFGGRLVKNFRALASGGEKP